MYPSLYANDKKISNIGTVKSNWGSSRIKTICIYFNFKILW